MATNILRSARRACGIAALVCGLSAPAFAQEITAEHLQASREAIAAIGATSQFDSILLAAALNLKSQLIQANPDQESVISATVDEVALQLAGRRGDLEAESARVYANYFTQGELEAIASFYSSDAGRKLLANGPQATRDVLRAADIWGRGITRDLAVSANEALAGRLGNTTPQAPDVSVQPPATQ